MKKTLQILFVLLLFAFGKSNVAIAQEMKSFSFVQATKTTGNLTNAPKGVTATFNNSDKGDKFRITIGDSMKLTIKGLADGLKITGVKLNVQNNAYTGNGTAAVSLGNAVLGRITIRGLGKKYILKDITPFIHGVVSDGQSLTITIKARESSVYCKQFIIFYQENSYVRSKTTLAFKNPSDQTYELNDVLGATISNPATLTPTIKGASVKYTSSDANVADVNGKGDVHINNAGKATITASFDGDDTHQGSSISYNITIEDHSKRCRWIRTPLQALSPSDQFVIADLNSKTAMSNTEVTLRAPKAVAITMNESNDELTCDIPDSLVWNMSAKKGSYTFYPNGRTDIYLYINNFSRYNGLRISSYLSNMKFSFFEKDKYSGLVINFSTDPLYVYVNNNQEWRTCINTANANTSMAYFKRYSVDETGKIPTSIIFDKGDTLLFKNSSTAVSAEYINKAKVVTADCHTVLEDAKITYTANNDEVKINDGIVSLDGVRTGTYTITASYGGNSIYAASSASYTIRVEDGLDLNGSGKETNPYTVADALTITSKDKQSTMGQDVYVKGVVSQVELFDEQSKTLSYYISDDDNTKRIHVPEAKYINSTGFSAKDQIAVGDVVLIKGDISASSSSEGNASIAEIRNNSIVEFLERKEVLDQASSTKTITTGHNVTITLKRTFNANAWNTLVLPFDLTEAQIESSFGSNAIIASYIGATKNVDDTYTLNFRESKTITANVPVFIYGAESKADGYTFSSVEVKDGEPVQLADGFNFEGTYVCSTVPKGNYFINSKNKFFLAGDNKTGIYGTRATFAPTETHHSAKGLGFNIDTGGLPTSLRNAVAGERVDESLPLYNLAGQRVSAAYKGIVVHGNRKIIRK